MTSYKFYNLTNYKMFKAVFSKEKNRDLLEELLYEATNKRFKIISLEMTEVPKENIHKKGKILDIIAKTENGKIVNIELNNSEADYLNRRNASYIFNLYNQKLQTCETYQNMGMFIQINLTNGKKDVPIDGYYTLYDKKNNRTFIDNFEIYEINLQKAKEAWYNKPRGKKILPLIACDEEELDSAIGDGYVERVQKEVKYLNTDSEFVRFMSEEDEERLYTNSLKQQYMEAGLKEGIEQGLNQRNIEIAKNMLKENININTISKVTELSIEEIENLK